MWYSLRDDVDRCWMQPSKNMSDDRRGIRPSTDMSTYWHRAVGYGHSPHSNNVHRVQHCFITPGQRRHVNIKGSVSFTIKIMTGIFFLQMSEPPPITERTVEEFSFDPGSGSDTSESSSAHTVAPGNNSLFPLSFLYISYCMFIFFVFLLGANQNEHTWQMVLQRNVRSIQCWESIRFT